MKILAIETSCDETAAAVVEDGRHVLSSIVSSQVDLHAAFGGVVPEIASRAHVDLLTPVVAQALLEAGVPAEQIEVAGICTQCESDRFFSHRANHGQPAGRFAALIRVEG